jgi:hypothetical protein
MRLLLVLLLLFPGAAAMASDECSFKGPGDSFVISSTSEMEIYKKAPGAVAMNSCKDSGECMLPKEPALQPVKSDGGLSQGDVMSADSSGSVKGAR